MSATKLVRVRAWGLGLAGVMALSGCVPVEARGGRSAIEGEGRGDGPTCALDGSGDGTGGHDAASAGVDDAREDGPGARDDGSGDGDIVRPTTGFRLEVTPARAEVLRGGRVSFEVRVVRAVGFEAPIVVQAFGLPAGCAAEPVAAAALPAALVVTAEGLAPAASYVPFAIDGSAAGTRATARAEIAVTGPPIFEE